ncbi:hypothetical protein Scep_026181 [Stephania cephalantha]|uniref:Uncharacterized protein n=1 Tax=Stephania cephalantha TaxID=152367 RepID=A0AAP0EPW9_9MAGN
MKVMAFGRAPSIRILQNKDNACFPYPFKAKPAIIEFHVMTFFTGMPSKTTRALSMLPHFPYMSTRAVPTVTLSFNFLSSIKECNHIPSSSDLR